MYKVGLWLVVGLFLPLFSASAVGGELKIIFLDVGQGDSILFITPDGSTLLIDGGPDTKADWLLQNYVSPYTCRLNAVLLTHSDADHVSGLGRIGEHCYIDMVFQNFVPKDTAAYNRWLEASSRFINQELYVSSHFSMSGANFYVIWPPEDLEVNATNNHSMSLLIDYNDFEALFTGDLESNLQGGMFENLKSVSGVIDWPFELYKASHHGASNGLYKPLMQWLKPETVVISVGAKNTYGHPSKEVLDFFTGIGSRIFRTDRDGTIEISVK